MPVDWGRVPVSPYMSTRSNNMSRGIYQSYVNHEKSQLELTQPSLFMEFYMLDSTCCHACLPKLMGQTMYHHRFPKIIVPATTDPTTFRSHGISHSNHLNGTSIHKASTKMVPVSIQASSAFPMQTAGPNTCSHKLSKPTFLVVFLPSQYTIQNQENQQVDVRGGGGGFSAVPLKAMVLGQLSRKESSHY